MKKSISENALDLIEYRPPRGVVIIAELGVNHDGQLSKALELVAAAAAAGADAIKLQLFEPSELCSARYRADEIRMLTPLALTENDLHEILVAAAAAGLAVFATPFDEPSLQRLLRFDIPVIKVASGEVTHLPFLERVARAGRPVILSSGACGLVDIDRAVAQLHGSGCRSLSLLHCVSAYPPPDETLNLRIIPRLRERYPNCTIGFSDHSLGLEAAVAAVALGAQIVEKHLTMNRDAPGPDHAASADPPQLATLVRALRRVETMLGQPEKHRLPAECAIARSIVAARDLAAGHEVRSGDLAFKRAGAGLRPYQAHELIGRRLRRAVARDEQILTADVVDTAG